MCDVVSGLRKAQHRALLPARRLLHEQRAHKIWSRVQAAAEARAEAEAAAVGAPDGPRAGLVNGAAVTGGQGGGVGAAGKGKKKKKKGGGAGAAAGGAAVGEQQGEGKGEEDTDGREAGDTSQGKGRSKGTEQQLQRQLLLQQGQEEDEEEEQRLGLGRKPNRQEQTHGEAGWEVQEQEQDQQPAGALASSPFNPMPHAAPGAPLDGAGLLQLPAPAPEGLVGGMEAWMQLARLSLCWHVARRRCMQLRAIDRELGGGSMFTVYKPGQDWSDIEKRLRISEEAKRLQEVWSVFGCAGPGPGFYSGVGGLQPSMIQRLSTNTDV